MKTIAAELLRIASLLTGKSGLQMNRKDKDLISDTGGGSYMRVEPKVKPPREDVKKPFSKKNKKPSERDRDVDNDPDLNKSASIIDRIFERHDRETLGNGYK